MSGAEASSMGVHFRVAETITTTSTPMLAPMMPPTRPMAVDSARNGYAM
jgi:hypothetical protein